MSMFTFEAQTDAYRSGQLIRVVNYHNTPHSQADALERELLEYAEHFCSVSLEDLDLLFDTGEWHKSKPGFLPVFYEGYRNSATVAAPLCDKLGLTGWFPVATAFIDTPVEHQEVFARSHSIGLVEEELKGERIAMTWEEVRQLSERHVVTPHTASHAGLESVVDDADLEREVFEPKRRLDGVTGQSSPAFVWLHGTSYGRSQFHDDAVVAAGYRYQLSNTMIQRLPDA